MEWSDSWSVFSQHRFWRSIGEYHGLRRESLILSQDPIYAGIRRSWFLLQQGMNLLDQDLRGGIQNVAQLYEIWCLVKLDEFIKEDKSWTCVCEPALFNTVNEDFSDETEELRTGCAELRYTHNNNAELVLLFQPTATKNPTQNPLWDGMMSVPVVQRPDIVRLYRNDIPNKPVFTWIFDAKYRIDSGRFGDKSNAPDDALNQMHRYRDAILWANDKKGEGQLTRESIGAYVLFPGDENLLVKNKPQIDSVDITNIGAYPLRPGNPVTASDLKNRLNILIGIDNDSFIDKQREYYKAVPAVRMCEELGFAHYAYTASKPALEQFDDNTQQSYYWVLEQFLKKEKINPKTLHYLYPLGEYQEYKFYYHVLSSEKKTWKQICEACRNKKLKLPAENPSDLEKYWLLLLGEPKEFSTEMADND